MKPKLAFAYDRQFTEHVFAAEQLQRLAGLCDILQHEPLLELISPAARAVLAETEILVTGWGAPSSMRQPWWRRRSSGWSPTRRAR